MRISRSDFNRRWSDLHGGVEIQGVIAGWLAISYVFARFLTFFRVSPNFVTFIGLVASLSLFQIDAVIIIALLILFSLICDGVDGSLAIYQNRTSRLGSLYDGLADRISEASWLIVAAYLFVPIPYAIAIWVLSATQEYARTRLASMGYAEIGVVTPTERPMRAIFMFLIIFLYYFGFEVTEYVAIAFIALQLISFLMVMRMARSILN
jgi:CDP-diacylglycerol--glycerol-3-phosphate 3-phosphatidyltransferase